MAIDVARRRHAKDLLDLGMLRFARSRSQDIFVEIMAVG
jgi:hypothetical protein